jgi:hypothetical protein
MRKPNYSMERKDRERGKQVKAAAKMEKRAAKGVENRESDASTMQDGINTSDAEAAKSDD